MKRIALKENIRKWINIGYLFPIVLLIIFYLIRSLSFPLHDFSNSYFAADLINNVTSPEKTLFDIYAFNSYAWDAGYPEVLIDFYLNSPFTLPAFLPLTFIENAYLAKMLFNVFSSLLFIHSVFLLIKTKVSTKNYRIFILLIPLIFYVPIRNQILFGQSYFLIFSLLIYFIYYLERNKQVLSVAFLSFAALLKVFPLFYGIILIINKQWKAILAGILITLLIVGISIPITGWKLWEMYFLEVLPNAMANNSTVNFQFNAQSIDVFLKTIFVLDPYYNPNALYDNKIAYIVIKWIVKSIIIGFALSLSITNKEKVFKLLSIWVVTLFLLQSRTATYAQILWVIPAFYVFNSKMSSVYKVLFFSLLFLTCNIPISKLQHLPLFFRFSRLWLTLIISSIFYFDVKEKTSYSVNIRAILATIIVMAPLNIKTLLTDNNSMGEYVLTKNYFMIHDFKAIDGKLNYSALGKNGNENIQTDIPISSFDNTACTIIENQIFIHGKQLTDNSALKKNPVLVNNNEVYYLSDFNSRRGAFTLKKINIQTSN